MDRLAALLDGPRARGAFVLRSLLVAPWAMSIRDEAPLTLVAVTRGEAWIGHGDTATWLPRGTVALVRGPEHYSFASAPDIEPDIVIHPGQICETVNGDALGMSMRLGVYSWGHSLDAPTVLLTGTYEQHSAIGNDLLDTLPPVVVIERRPDDPLLSLLAHELTNEVPASKQCSTASSMRCSSTPCARSTLSDRATARRGGAGIATRSSVRRCASSTINRSTPGRSQRSHGPSVRREPISPGGSATSSVNRSSPTSRGGG
jgi:hypothetical protein